VVETLALEADLFTVRTAAPLPPGSRVRLDLAGVGGQHAPFPSGKVVDLERTAAGDYRLLVRLHSLPRQERTALEELVAGSDRI
jgi:hypothetical protein